MQTAAEDMGDERAASAPRMSRPAAGDAFDRLVRREYQGLVAASWAIVGQRAVAEEIVQGVLLKAFRRWSTLQTYDRPGAWLRKVTVRDSVSVVRRRKAELRALFRARRRVPDVAPPDDVVAFWDAVRSLTPAQRQVVALRGAADYSIDEIADALGMNANTVKSHLRRARQQLDRSTSPGTDR